MNAAESTLWRRLRTTRLRDVVRGRIDGRLNWRYVIAAAELPAEVARVIEQVVRLTRLWRCEKVDVAQELIAHFQDGLDAGHTPQALVESFGDPAQAARLIRRAKKRGRSVAWQVWRWACWSMAALVVLYVATAVYLIMGRPSIKTDYLAIVNERALAVPEDQRAWPLYRDAVTQMDLIHSPPWMKEAVDLRPNDKAWPEASAWVSEHGDSLAMLRQASLRSELGFPVWSMEESFSPEDRRVLPELGRNLDESELGAPTFEPLSERWLIGTLLPHLGAMRDSVRILAFDARRAAMEGDGAASFADVVAILNMSHHFEEQPFLVNAHVAAAMQRLAFATIQDMLRSHSAIWSDDQLRDLAHIVAAAKIDWHFAYAGERLSFHDVVQRLYTDDGHGDGRITVEGLRAFNKFGNQSDIDKATGLNEWRMQLGDVAIEAAAPASLYLMASRSELVEKYDRFMNHEETALDRPLWEGQDRDTKGKINGWSKLEKARYLPITLLMPALSSLRNSVERHRGVREGVLVGIALELYHREHEAWPSTLEELVPRFLPQIPVDRISGGPLGYRIVDDRPLVYSLGVDSDDDGGRLPEDCHGDRWSYHVGPPDSRAPDGDWVIWSTVRSEVQETGEDP